MPKITHLRLSIALKNSCDIQIIFEISHVIFISDEDTPPPWKKDVSIDVESVNSSSELLSTPPSTIHQNLPPSTTRKGYRGKNGDDGCMYDRDPCETQEGGKPREGNTLTNSLYQQG